MGSIAARDWRRRSVCDVSPSLAACPCTHQGEVLHVLVLWLVFSPPALMATFTWLQLIKKDTLRASRVPRWVFLYLFPFFSAMPGCVFSVISSNFAFILHLFSATDDCGEVKLGFYDPRELPAQKIRYCFNNSNVLFFFVRCIY